MRLPLPVLGTILSGGCAAAAGIWRLPDASMTAVALFCAAAIVTELVEESARDRLREPVGSEGVRLASAVHVAALLVLGPWVAALVAAVGVLAGAALRPRAFGDALVRAGASASATATPGLPSALPAERPQS